MGTVVKARAGREEIFPPPGYTCEMFVVSY